MIIGLGDLQCADRTLRRGNQRRELRDYLIDGAEPSAAAFQTVSRFLYATKQNDHIGLSDIWLATATVRERAAVQRNSDRTASNMSWRQIGDVAIGLLGGFMKVDELGPGNWAVTDNGVVLSCGFKANAEAAMD